MIELDQIKAGLENSEFHMVYMPTISLVDSKCVGAEALIRWNHAGHNISPDKFISVCENTSLSGLLTYWVIEQIGNELGDWLRENENVHIAINVPPELVGRGGLEYAADKANLMGVKDKLILEITERGFPDQLALDTIGLTDNVKVAIDDFGTGDANLLQLSQMDADIIKLDKYFIDQITDEQNIPKIVKGITAYALAMDLEIIAEGVESQVQVNVLKQLGVHMAQGWHFSKPLVVDNFINYHAQN
jgi:sensor c-di-GMP phosphodiesterase-like protein